MKSVLRIRPKAKKIYLLILEQMTEHVFKAFWPSSSLGFSTTHLIMQVNVEDEHFAYSYDKFVTETKNVL
jgi:hypothetical protein